MANDAEGAAEGALNSDVTRFIIVGISNIAIGYAVFAVALHLLGDFVLRGTVAQIIAYCVGTVWSYYWNRRWTFRSDADVGGEASRFIILQIGCAVISTGGVGVTVDALHLHPTLSWLGVVGVVSVINYVLSKRWVFKGKET